MSDTDSSDAEPLVFKSAKTTLSAQTPAYGVYFDIKTSSVSEVVLRRCPTYITDQDVSTYLASPGPGTITDIHWANKKNGVFSGMGI